MASDYSLRLKALLDTSDVQAKLQLLGSTGSVATSLLEDSIKKLDTAVKDLSLSWKTSAREAQQTGFLMQKILRGGAAMLIGGAISRISNYAAATGNTTGAQAANLAGNMLKGAGAGAAMGSAVPGVGTSIGAAIGLTAGALDTLTEAATKSAQALEGWVTEAKKNILEHRFDLITRERLKEIAGIEDVGKLQDIAKNAKKTQQGREDWIKSAYERMRLAEEEIKKLDNKSYKSYLGKSPTEIGLEMNKDNETKERLKRLIAQDNADLEQWDKQAKGAAAIQAAAEKKLEEIRQREIDRVSKRLEAKLAQVNAVNEQKKDEDEAFRQGEENAKAEQKAMGQATTKPPEEFLRNVKQAGSALGSFLRDRRLEAFEASLEDMSPADLMRLRDSLAGQKAAAAAQVESLFGTAKQTGLASDVEAALNALFAFNEIASKLDLTEAGIGELKTPSIQERMMALGSEAQKGYDTSGYGSIDQEILKSEKSTEQNTKEAASTLKTINTKLEEVKTAITSNANGANWQ